VQPTDPLASAERQTAFARFNNSYVQDAENRACWA
jgi:hypothetical protein